MTPLQPQDKQAIACNYREGTNVAAEGALAYVVTAYLGGNLPERLYLLVRSRGGRWIEKWEATRRLKNFRLKTIPPGHPRYDDERLPRSATQADLEICQRAVAELHPQEDQ